jgi:hypothetical protein
MCAGIQVNNSPRIGHQENLIGKGEPFVLPNLAPRLHLRAQDRMTAPSYDRPALPDAEFGAFQNPSGL